MNKVDVYKDVYGDLKKRLRWKVADTRSLMLIASLYVTDNQVYDGDSLEEMADYIKKEVGFFTTMQSHQRYTFAAMLLTRFQHPQEKFSEFIQMYKALVDGGFSMGAYTYVSAMVLLNDDKSHLDIAPRAMDVYKKMRKKHFFLTGQSDYPLAMLLAQGTKEIDTLIERIEFFYGKLNQSGFHIGNDLQTMSHILSLIEEVDPEVLVTRCTEIFDRLKDEGMKTKAMYYPQIAMLAFLTNGKEHITHVKEIQESLNHEIRWQKDMNFMMAVTLHLSDQIENSSLLQTNLSTTIETLIQAQQSASVAAIAGATAASNSGS
ncbi:DUF4003 domain-containing protein [Rossellomorea aquimaris]|uniref:DUF4003 family protein n=1 Tax=Rossellomorea aquimaris TaxID=189382 RepID=UPI001CD4363B|nr:DUF4003 family protein [Rossellomorea aquimaris]MCA1055689.1 DUF4003 domain-containing protein [Rossellomorea aquimaris]